MFFRSNMFTRVGVNFFGVRRRLRFLDVRVDGFVDGEVNGLELTAMTGLCWTC